MSNAPQHELTSIWTPANIVTCVRIVFIPVFMLFATDAFSFLGLTGGIQAIIAFCLYMLLSCTDKVDGELARKRGEVTDFGKFLDPIADKLLVFSALLLLQSDCGLRLPGSTLGVVGCGHVGSRVCAVGRELGMRVLVCDPPVGAPGYVGMDVIEREADVVTFHVPLTDSGPYATRHLADSRRRRDRA